jgi:hypothetical protein
MPGHDLLLDATSATDVEDVAPRVELRERLRYGQGGEYVPPGASARYHYPHDDPPWA